MTAKEQWIAFYTILYSEWQRMFRIWTQVLVPPVITSVLYFIIFGHVIGARVGTMAGFPYIQYIAPGLIMMNIITSSFATASSAVFGAKIHRSIEELLVAPISNCSIVLGFMCAGMMRGLIVGLLVSVVSLCFTHLVIHSVLAVLLAAVLSSSLFALGGVISAVFAKSFDQISIILTFVLTPLIYLGGVFYSLRLLPAFWQKLSFVNPIVYMIDNFRYGFLGISDGHLLLAYMLMVAFVCFFSVSPGF